MRSPGFRLVPKFHTKKMLRDKTITRASSAKLKSFINSTTLIDKITSSILLVKCFCLLLTCVNILLSLRGDNPKKNRSCGGEYTTNPPQKINVRIK